MGYIILGITAIIFLTLFLLSKGKYNEFLEPLDKEAYKMKDIIPMGLYVLDLLKYKFTNSYDKNLLNKVAEINDAKYAYYYLQIHTADKISLVLLLMLVFGILIGAAGPVDPGFLVFSIATLIVSFWAKDKELDNKVKKRRMSMELEFPDFLNKLILLINAGMTVSRAWEKVNEESNKASVLYKEVQLVMMQIDSNMSEVMAYEEFAKRCRIPHITKFTSIIVQNLKKGSAEMTIQLRQLAEEGWEIRKHTAKRVGEEASTKMLFPMMLMFFAIIIIVMTPAIIALRNF
jgi:tight adherence protein C